MTTVKDFIADLTNYYDPEDQIAISIWQTGDIVGRAKDRGMSVSQATAEDIIGKIHSNHDASIGISWDTIDYWLDTVAQESEVMP